MMMVRSQYNLLQNFFFFFFFSFVRFNDDDDVTQKMNDVFVTINDK